MFPGVKAGAPNAIRQDVGEGSPCSSVPLDGENNHRIHYEQQRMGTEMAVPNTLSNTEQKMVMSGAFILLLRIVYGDLLRCPGLPRSC